MNEVHTVNQLMTVASQAMLNGDVDTLMRLEGVVDSWMQTEEERASQMVMLGAMIEMMENR